MVAVIIIIIIDITINRTTNLDTTIRTTNVMWIQIWHLRHERPTPLPKPTEESRTKVPNGP